MTEWWTAEQELPRPGPIGANVFIAENDTLEDLNHFCFACIPNPKSTDFIVNRIDTDHEGICGK